MCSFQSPSGRRLKRSSNSPGNESSTPPLQFRPGIMTLPSLDSLDIPKHMMLIQHINDIMLTRPAEQEMASTLIVLKQICTTGRKRNLTKIQRPLTLVMFLGV